MFLYGMRLAKTIEVKAGTVTPVGRHGEYGFLEVTNAGEADATLLLNNGFEHQGTYPSAVKIPAGSTRQVPVQAYNVTADADLTIVAYGR